MTQTMVDRLATEIVGNEALRPFNLDARAVASTIARAKSWHDEDVAIFTIRDPAASLVPRLSVIRRAIEKAHREWNGIEAADRDLVRRFISTDSSDEVGDRLLGLIDLMDDFAAHFAREPGNPQRSRDGQDLDLRPLYTFVEILRDFWLKTVGTDMSAAIEDRDKDTGEASAPTSPAMIFLSDAVSALNVPYSVTSLQTVVRSLRRREVKPLHFD
jgi:hypothetical protein